MRSHPTLAPRPQICLIGSNGFCAVAGEGELNSKSLAFRDKVCYNCNKKPGLQTVFCSNFFLLEEREVFFYGKHYYQSIEGNVQGKGELANIAQYATKLGKKPFILISEGGKKRVGGIIEDSFKDTGCELVFEAFHGECSKNEINRLVAIVKEKGCDLVIGVGGGKIFDTAKAVAYYVESPVIVCPTIAATDAPVLHLL